MGSEYQGEGPESHTRMKQIVSKRRKELVKLVLLSNYCCADDDMEAHTDVKPHVS